ncbi:hypothetical protein [Microbulbifer hydrolyticus]|uniref:Uncharacterized protein n=1 Tax=Microbulbifer hydrolyticus TaxID=48074 RepID=A0A6P1TFY4_9GAMM|nr:hypothetical protein [Microbulbifer hydrolyticus]MBB5213106.1 hypothetical protein [Microbulbifer hydrolyticus]QHQ40460.1 hypothetical protein GTQ55_16745 [Microbulbifer hydrolyticus]
MSEKKPNHFLNFIVCVAIAVLPLMFFISGFTSGEVESVGRRSHETHVKTPGEGTYWQSLLVWLGLFVFLVGSSFVELYKYFKHK